MAIRLTFELSDRDLRYFRTALKESREAVRDADEQDILDAIRQALNDIRKNEPLPDFVAQRLPVIDNFIDMLLDEEWRLPRADRERLLAMFIYFSDPEDILPDDIPVVGYLDDVVIIELVTRDMLHISDAYDDFCRFRSEYDRDHAGTVDGAIRRDRLDRKRQQLHQRMRRRSARISKLGDW